MNATSSVFVTPTVSPNHFGSPAITVEELAKVLHWRTAPTESFTGMAVYSTLWEQESHFFVDHADRELPARGVTVNA